MSSCRELLKEGTEYLRASEIPEPENNAWQLFSFVTGMDKGRYFLRMGEELPADHAEAFRVLLTRRATHLPLQYLTGSQVFMGYEFQVSPAVLIPRQDTETLVEAAFSYGKDVIRKRQARENSAGSTRDMEAASGKSSGARETEPFQILDVCTGSGCIGISLFLLLREAGADCLLTLTDLSEEALSVARANAERLISPADLPRVSLLQGDLLAPLSGRFDLIVSNPPYIPTGEIEGLMEEVKDFEPRMALDGSGDGLLFYRRLAYECRAHLEEEGRIFWEIGFDQGEDVSRILKEKGWKEIRVLRDLAGNPRVVTAGL